MDAYVGLNPNSLETLPIRCFNCGQYCIRTPLLHCFIAIHVHTFNHIDTFNHTDTDTVTRMHTPIPDTHTSLIRSVDTSIHAHMHAQALIAQYTRG